MHATSNLTNLNISSLFVDGFVPGCYLVEKLSLKKPLPSKASLQPTAVSVFELWTQST